MKDHSVYVCSEKIIADPLVSVLMWTYNDCRYIEQAIDSVLAQKTTFGFELVISDDCSKDGTTEIIKAYQEKYPQAIRLILSTENLWKSGVITERLLAEGRGRYIALHHGDDYWTDPLKVQKQVDFMEAHTTCTYCGHNSYSQNGAEGVLDRLKPIPLPASSGGLATLLPHDELFKQLVCQDVQCMTASVMLRGVVVRMGLPDWLARCSLGDLPLSLLFSKVGEFGALPDYMSVYRVYDKGAWSSRDPQLNLVAKVAAFVLMAGAGSFSTEERDILYRRAVELSAGWRGLAPKSPDGSHDPSDEDSHAASSAMELMSLCEWAGAQVKRGDAAQRLAAEYCNSRSYRIGHKLCQWARMFAIHKGGVSA